MRFSRRLLTVAALALLVIAGSSSVVAATPYSDKDTFNLKIINAHSRGTIAQVTLRCHSRWWGGHPQAAAACKDLARGRVDGHIERIRPAHGMWCLKNYDPVIAQATGWWRGYYRWYERKFGNRCEANQRTGGNVFNF